MVTKAIYNCKKYTNEYFTIVKGSNLQLWKFTNECCSRSGVAMYNCRNVPIKIYNCKKFRCKITIVKGTYVAIYNCKDVLPIEPRSICLQILWEQMAHIFKKYFIPLNLNSPPFGKDEIKFLSLQFQISFAENDRLFAFMQQLKWLCIRFLNSFDFAQITM